MNIEPKDIFLLAAGAFLGWLLTWTFERFKTQLQTSYFLSQQIDDHSQGWFYFEYRNGWKKTTYTKRPVIGSQPEEPVSAKEFESVRTNLIRRVIP